MMLAKKVSTTVSARGMTLKARSDEAMMVGICLVRRRPTFSNTNVYFYFATSTQPFMNQA